MRRSAAALLAAAGLAGLALPAAADDGVGVSATVAIMNDYLSRGFSLNNTPPAANITVDATAPGGLIFGLWAATYDVDANFDAFDWEYEIAPYVGWTGTVFDNTTARVDAYYYTYHGDGAVGAWDYLELSAGLTYDFGFANVAGTVFYSPDYQLETGSAWYKKLQLNIPVLDTVTAYGWVANQTVHDIRFDRYDFGLGATLTTPIVNLDVQWNRLDNPGGRNFIGVKVFRTVFF